MKHFYLKKIGFQLVLLFMGISFSPAVHAQGWLRDLPQNKVHNNTLTLKDYQKAFNVYRNKESFKEKTLKIGNELLDENYAKFKRWEWYWESRVNPVTGVFPTVTAYTVFKQYLITHPKAAAISRGNWVSMGPSKTKGGSAGLGRVNYVAFSPVDTSTLYIGSASGGIWKTTNLGTNWTPLGDFNNALGVAGIVVVNKGGQDIVYLATGDKDHWDTYSIGVLKSLDGGHTWNKTGLSWKPRQYRMIFRLLPDPKNNNTLYAATNAGLYKTTDGANTWQIIDSLHFFRDIEFQPGSNTWMIGSTYSGEIYYSKDSGVVWTKALSEKGGGRTELAVTPDSANVVYAIMSNANDYGFYGFYKSIDGGVNFAKIPDSLNLLGWNCNGSDTGGQGWYDLAIAADPHNASRVYVGGVNTWVTQDGGKSWKESNNWSSTCNGKNEVVHADKHYLVFQKGTNALFECNDGGIYKTKDGEKWQNLGSGLVISQIYRLGISKTDAGEVITGLQDNGTKLMWGGNWYDVYGGDGMECLIDYTNFKTQYAETSNGDIKRTTNHWQTVKDIASGLTGKGAWVTPYVMDPVNHKTLFIGYNNIFKSTDQGDNWKQVSNFKKSATMRSIAIAPSNNQYIYAATKTVIYQSKDGSNSWKDITGSLPIDKASITYIAVKNNNPNTVWVTMGGYNNYGVFETQNSGVTWNNISTGLPDIPINCIVQNKLKDTTQLYAGTDVGVFVRQGNSAWVPFINHLPNVPVDELKIRYDNSGSGKLYAATFGRGLWASDLFNGYIPPILAANFEANITDPTIKDTVKFRDLSTDKPISWKWQFLPGTITYLSNTNSTSQNPMVRFDQPGYYSVSLIATGQDTILAKTIVSYILAKDVFHVTIKANRTTVCSGDTTQLFADVTGGSGSYKYSWSTYPLGFSSTLQNPVIKPSHDTTSYRVTVFDGNNSTGNKITIYKVECTGISNNIALTGKIKIFPNPNTGKFTVETEKNIEKIEIISQSGSVIFERSYQGRKATIYARMSRGIYFVKITLGNTQNSKIVTIRKVVIQ